jgi:hypothetical protein
MTAFGGLTSIEKAIEFMLEYVRIWQAWMDCPQALHVRYEDMLSDYDGEIERLLGFLDIQPSEAVSQVVEQYRPGQTGKDDKGLHFHKGQPERFREVLTPQQLAACNQAFGGYLEKMGYAE